MERLYILDGSGYIYRAYYGIGGSRGRTGAQLSTVSGMPTGALYVYTQMLVRLYRDIKPERIAVVFDAPGRTFRKELHDGYKATRRETPDDLKPQLKFFPEITEALCWPVLSISGVEADDVIATLVTKARERDWKVTIFSADKDVMQLVGDDVEVIDSLRNVTYDAATVEKKYGVLPGQLRDYLALVGDASDNVPGMKGVGKVTASKLLGKYGSLDELLSHTGELKGKQKERFEDPALLEQLRLSRQLVTLRHDVEISSGLEELKAGKWDEDKLISLFRRLEFNVLLERLGPVADAPAQDAPAQKESRKESRDDSPAAPAQTELDLRAPAPGASDSRASKAANSPSSGQSPSQRTLGSPEVPDTAVIASPDQLAATVAAIRAAGKMVIQVETDGARPDRARLVGICVVAPGAAPAYIPVAHRYLSAPAQIEVGDLPKDLLAALADPEIAVVCHDAKSTTRALVRLGIELAGVTSDTMLTAYLLEPDRKLTIERVLALGSGISLPERKTLLGKGRTKIDFEAVAVERAAEWSGKAAFGILLSHEVLESQLRDVGLYDLMHDLELPIASLLCDIEQVGICIDVPYLRDLSSKIGGEVASLEKQVYELAGEEINIGSPKQLAALLFDKLGLEGGKKKKTKTGYSTDHEVLESLLDAHPIIPLIIEHRELVKLKGTYLDALPPLVNPTTGRLHTSFNQGIAATGRLSSQDPNLQNIPIRTELGRKIRRAFVAAPGKTLVSVDYSQIELRILAHLSEDPVLVKAFRDGVDVHTQTAAEVFDIPLEEVGATERRVAKAVNYGLIYGQSQFGLAQTLGISRGEAKEYMTRYFDRFSTVKTFMEETIERARQAGHALTVLGRRRLLPEIGSRNFQRRKLAERMAQNTPMQGSAADIIKLAMLRVADRMKRDKADAAMLLTVHDELVFEVAPDQAKDFAAAMSAEMESAYELAVPLEATVGIADNWADAH